MLVLPPKKYIASFDVDAHNNPEMDASIEIDEKLNQQALLAGYRLGSKNKSENSLLSKLPSPNNYNFFIWKGLEDNLNPVGSCYHDLEEELTNGVIEFLQAHQIQCIILGGSLLETSVQQTAKQLRMKGFEVIINLEACVVKGPSLAKKAIQECLELHIKVIKSIDELK
jgi:nicotinamidase-related amidase